MAKSNITWEWGNHDDQVIIRKAKGRLTMDDIWDFLCKDEQLNAFGENSLAVIVFRLRRPEYAGWESEKPEGDAQDVYILADGAKCICGRSEVYRQYCPECGHALILPDEKGAT